jgi:hypothetical protein
VSARAVGVDDDALVHRREAGAHDAHGVGAEARSRSASGVTPRRCRSRIPPRPPAWSAWQASGRAFAAAAAGRAGAAPAARARRRRDFGAGRELWRAAGAFAAGGATARRGVAGGAAARGVAGAAGGGAANVARGAAPSAAAVGATGTGTAAAGGADGITAAGVSGAGSAGGAGVSALPVAAVDTPTDDGVPQRSSAHPPPTAASVAMTSTAAHVVQAPRARCLVRSCPPHRRVAQGQVVERQSSLRTPRRRRTPRALLTPPAPRRRASTDGAAGTATSGSAIAASEGVRMGGVSAGRASTAAAAHRRARCRRAQACRPVRRTTNASPGAPGGSSSSAAPHGRQVGDRVHERRHHRVAALRRLVHGARDTACRASAGLRHRQHLESGRTAA